MTTCGDEDDCISTPEAAELAAKLDEKEINNLPRPGEVDFINGGPLCQVRFGILEAGAYGVSQSRKRAFIWAASPEETPPEWPEPMHVFACPELKIALNGKNHFVAVRSTSTGAPFRATTVRDTIRDLPAVKNGASTTTMERIAHALQISHPIIDVGYQEGIRHPYRLYQAIESMTHVLEGQHIDEAGPSSAGGRFPSLTLT